MELDRIAANLAQAFIRKGVRAVVAAGWAVGDAPAAAFARKFYQLMLSGARFGEATRSARRHIYDQFSSDNTWGAYQCYGDPDYRLLMDSGSGVGWTPRADSKLVEIKDIEVQLQTASDAGTIALVARLDEIARDLEKPLKDGALALALARAYWEALNFESTVQFHRQALTLDPQVVTLKDIEQFANQLARYAVDVFDRSPGEKGREQAEALLTEAEEVLEWLKKMWQGTASETIERWNLVGSICKRRAMIAADKSGDLRRSLAAMGKHYDRAVKLARTEGKESHYPALNVIVAAIVERWLARPTKASDAAQLRAQLAEVAATIASLKPPVPQFWLGTAKVDCLVLEALIDGKFAKVKPEAIARRYRNHRSRSSRREYGSVCDQIDFLARMADRANRKEIATGLQRLLEQMREA